jgi:phospholipid/cholesterol/gamma-HCH transport system substrate-binding protein
VKPWHHRHPAATGAIGLLLLAALVLAAFRVEDLPLVGGGTDYQAAFRDASGLASGDEVRVAGVTVGTVRDVALARGDEGAYVRVTFRVTDRDLRLGEDTGATIRIRTVLGRKYLALEPAAAGTLAPGAEIPASRTASPFDVLQAVGGLAETLDGIDTAQLALAFDTLSDTFADTPDSVQAALTGLSRLSQTIADRDEELRELLARADTVTAVLAERDEEFRRLLADGNLLLAEVIRRKEAISRLLEATSELSRQLSGLVADNRDQLDPALAELREVIGILQRNRDQLEQTLVNFGPFIHAFTNVVGHGRWFDSYVDGLVQVYEPGGSP